MTELLQNTALHGLFFDVVSMIHASESAWLPGPDREFEVYCAREMAEQVFAQEMGGRK